MTCGGRRASASPLTPDPWGPRGGQYLWTRELWLVNLINARLKNHNIVSCSFYFYLYLGNERHLKIS